MGNAFKMVGGHEFLCGRGSKPMVPFWVGTPISIFFSGDWDVHWWYVALTYGHVGNVHQRLQINSHLIFEGASCRRLFGDQSGTKIVLHLREEAQEYLDTGKLSDLLKTPGSYLSRAPLRR